MPVKSIDLNCDLGESFGAYVKGMDDQVMSCISSANIACGWHAGDPIVMSDSVMMAASHKVACGAHPGYPDLLGFGRRNMAVNRNDLKCYLVYQIGALNAFCALAKIKLRHVKPHGSLYLTAVEDENTAAAIAEAIAAVDPGYIYVTLAGQKGSMMARIGRDSGLTVAYEGFPDRAYTRQGTLAPRNLPGAVISDPQQVADRAVQMAREGKTITIDGDVIDLQVDTLCVHGDNPHAVEVVRQVRKALDQEDICVEPMGTRAIAG